MKRDRKLTYIQKKLLSFAPTKNELKIQRVPFLWKVCLGIQKVSEVTIYFYAILPPPYGVDTGFGL